MAANRGADPLQNNFAPQCCNNNIDNTAERNKFYLW